MKKLTILLSLSFILCAQNAFCHPHHHYPYYHTHYSSCNNCVYVIRSDNYQTQEKFQNCDRHSLLIDTTINYYSNGSRRSFNTYTVLDEEGRAIISNCYDIKHITNKNEHYFLAKIGKYYKIIDENGAKYALRKYTKMSEIATNRVLVMVDKKYGIIDIKENIIVPIKYKEFEQISPDLFITKLNGYYGIIDSSNNSILFNEYDKIKPLYDTYIIEKEGKYGLISNTGKILFEANYDNIKKLGEYILIKKDKNYGILNAQGEALSEIKYKKIKIKRNKIQVKLNKNWEAL